MIVTVTMNPAIDKTVDIDALERGGLNRIQKVEYDAGGKGLMYPRRSASWAERVLPQDFWAATRDAQSKRF